MVHPVRYQKFCFRRSCVKSFNKNCVCISLHILGVVIDHYITKSFFVSRGGLKTQLAEIMFIFCNIFLVVLLLATSPNLSFSSKFCQKKKNSQFCCVLEHNHTSFQNPFILCLTLIAEYREQHLRLLMQPALPSFLQCWWRWRWAHGSNPGRNTHGSRRIPPGVS